MLKNILILCILFLGIPALAQDNFLNSVVLSKVDNRPTVVLRTDSVAKIKKEIQSKDRMMITLKNVKQSNDISTLYKNVSDANGLIIQNSGNDTEILVEAPDIYISDIVFETPNSAPIVVSDIKDEGKLLWSIISVILFITIIAGSKSAMTKPVKKDINEIIKEREKELYKNFQKEIATIPSMNYKLKGYRKHVLKGETIRSYESRMTRI